MQGTQANEAIGSSHPVTATAPEIPDTILSPAPALVAARATAASEAEADAAAGGPTKRCDTCNAVNPASAEFFPRNKRRKDGLAARCHVCNREITNAWTKENRSKVNRNQQRRYWAKRKQGLVRVTKVIGGVAKTVWAKKAPATAAAPVTPEALAA